MGESRSNCWPHMDFDFISNSSLLNDGGFILDVLRGAVTTAGMQVKAGPIVWPTPVDGAWGHSEGLTGFVGLAESHAAIETFVEQKVVQFDLFSCKRFDYHAVADYLSDKMDADGKFEVHLRWRKFPPTRI